MFEYEQDLEYWHKNGYANALNYRMACPLLRDMVNVFKYGPIEQKKRTWGMKFGLFPA